MSSWQYDCQQSIIWDWLLGPPFLWFHASVMWFKCLLFQFYSDVFRLPGIFRWIKYYYLFCTYINFWWWILVHFSSVCLLVLLPLYPLYVCLVLVCLLVGLPQKCIAKFLEVDVILQWPIWLRSLFWTEWAVAECINVRVQILSVQLGSTCASLQKS